MGNSGKTLFPYRGPDGKYQIREFDNEQYGIDANTTMEYQALSSCFSKDTFAWDRLQEIKLCLDANMLRSSLILALTIPDICSRIEYPDSSNDKNGTRYARWFDEHITKYNIGKIGKEQNTFDCFNGYMCYLLRCRMLHGEPNDIEEVPNRKDSWLRKNGYDRIFFTFTSNQYSEFFTFKGKKKVALFCKSIPQLVMQIISCADFCYQRETDKDKFFDGCKIQWPQQMMSITIKGVDPNA